MEEPRTTAQRKADTLSRLVSDVDCWVTSASAEIAAAFRTAAGFDPHQPTQDYV